jgi:hypothetical protein
MQTLATILGFASGFALAGYHETAAGMIATSLAVDASLAPLTGVIASRRGRSAALWSVLGFPLGVWALTAILLLRPRSIEQSFPPPSNAA